MSGEFDITGSTADVSADDLLREICGDEPAAEGIVRDEAEERFKEAQAAETCAEESETDTDQEVYGSAATIVSLEEQINDDSKINGGNYSSSESESEDVSKDEHHGLPSRSHDSFDDYLAAHTGQYFILDISTFPDEQRFPRPLEANRVRQEIDLAKFAAGNADIISRTLKSGTLFEDQLEELQELENAGKMRATVLKDITKAFESIDGEFGKWKKDGMTNPWKGRIVAMSWSFLGEEEVHTIVAENEDSERELLSTFWALAETGTRVGYGISGMEDKWVVARSMILSVLSGTALETGRYSKQSVDIKYKLFPDDMPMDIATLANVVGIELPPDAAVGADVFGIVEAQDWESLQCFSEATVAVEKELFKRMKRYVRV